jgi:hypothetical protein
MSNGGVTFAAAIDRKLFLEDRRKFFREVYERPLPRVQLPASRIGFGWGGIMAPFMKGPQWLCDVARERNVAWKSTGASLDAVVAHNDRDPKTGAYAFWCRDRVEADEENADKSRVQIGAAGIKGMTVAEYIDLFIWFHWKTGRLLDRNHWTLLTGSRARGGSVPYSDSDDGELGVYWCNPSDARHALRAREVVVL